MTKTKLAPEKILFSFVCFCFATFRKGRQCLTARPCSTVSDTSLCLPHFHVVCCDKETTKVRIVFDLPATCIGGELNGYAKPGPKLQRFLIAQVCDISEKYFLLGTEDFDTKS